MQAEVMVACGSFSAYVFGLYWAILVFTFDMVQMIHGWANSLN